MMSLVCVCVCVCVCLVRDSMFNDTDATAQHNADQKFVNASASQLLDNSGVVYIKCFIS